MITKKQKLRHNDIVIKKDGEGRKHPDHIEDRSQVSMTLYNLVHKHIPIPQAMKIPDAKATVHKELGNCISFQLGMMQRLKK